MSNLHFERHMMVGLGGTQVEYVHPMGNGRKFTITASKFGVSFDESPVISSRGQMDAFARNFANAWKDYVSLSVRGVPADGIEVEEEAEIVSPEATNEGPNASQ